MAKRHKVETKKDASSAQDLLVKQIEGYEELELCRLLMEISLLDLAYQRMNLRADLLLDAAKRYRVDVEKVQKAVSVELATKRDKKSTRVRKTQ